MPFKKIKEKDYEWTAIQEASGSFTPKDLKENLLLILEYSCWLS